MAATLPSGPRGQALALGVTLVAAAILWLGIIAPLLEVFDDRAETLRRQTAMADRMAALIQTLPALQQQAAAAVASGRQTDAMLPGASDALAAAALQQKLDELATASDVRMGSQEILPAQASDGFRAIAVRVTTNAPWRSLVALFLALAQSETPMVADELALRGPLANIHDPDLPVDASFTVTSYRPANPSAGTTVQAAER